jgi:multicomponent Na+:H+ antiporter subunit D
MVSHGLIKALLFLCVSEVYLAVGTARISELRGRPLPRYAGPIFLLAALGLGGVPPMPAFWSKFQVFAVTAGAGYGWAAAVAVLTSLLTITTLLWAGVRAFWPQPDRAGEGDRSAFPWLLGIVVLAILAAGLAPGWMTGLLSSAAQALTAKGV